MIIAFIFFLHIIFLLIVIVKTLKIESIGAAIQNTIFVVIIFSVGWTLISFVINLFTAPIGFGKYFDRNTISLSILTIVEILFYFSKGASMIGITAKEAPATVSDKEIQ